MLNKDEQGVMQARKNAEGFKVRTNREVCTFNACDVTPTNPIPRRIACMGPTQHDPQVWIFVLNDEGKNMQRADEYAQNVHGVDSWHQFVDWMESGACAARMPACLYPPSCLPRRSIHHCRWHRYPSTNSPHEPSLQQAPTTSACAPRICSTPAWT